MIQRLRETKAADEQLARQVIGLAMKVHRTLGCGFVESVYANALLIELRRANLIHEREKVFPVVYEGCEVGVFQADLFVENRLIVELKSVEALAVAHSVQLVNYLAVSGLEFGLLLNFGTKSLQFKTKRDSTKQKKVRIFNPKIIPLIPSQFRNSVNPHARL